jgi:hypothetical protein
MWVEKMKKYCRWSSSMAEPKGRSQQKVWGALSDEQRFRRYKRKRVIRGASFANISRTSSHPSSIEMYLLSENSACFSVKVSSNQCQSHHSQKNSLILYLSTDYDLVFTRKFNAKLRNLIGRKFNSYLMHFRKTRVRVWGFLDRSLLANIELIICSIVTIRKHYR